MQSRTKYNDHQLKPQLVHQATDNKGQILSETDLTPVLEPGISRKSQLEPPPGSKKPSGKNEDDLIVTYYKLRRELEELKEKKATKDHKKSIEGEEIEPEHQ